MAPRTCYHNVLFATTIFLVFTFGNENNAFFVLGQGHGSTINAPEFLAQLVNLTVPQGRDVYFTCVVNNLGQYRVAWIKSDSKAILGIHTHMVSLNPRLSVTHNGHNTWKLHISHVQLNDSGSYMCQVNTDPMKSISGFLDVVVPPDILSPPYQNLDEGECNEGGSVTLICAATGVPDPQVQWRREGGKDIILRTEPRDKQAVKQIDGEVLTLTNVQRIDMGGYLCIASNGVPPTVSKRFDVHVNFPPSVKAVNQLVVAPIDREVTLECIIEVYPRPLNGWHRNEGNLKLHNSNKYNIAEALINLYTWRLNLTIRHLTKADFGAYTCSSGNALGKSEARIRLQELRLQPKATATPTTTQKPRRKQTYSQNKVLNEVVRAKETHLMHQTKEKETPGAVGTQNSSFTKAHNVVSIVNVANVGVDHTHLNAMTSDIEVLTQVPTKLSSERSLNNAADLSTPSSTWVFANGGNTIQFLIRGNKKLIVVVLAVFFHCKIITQNLLFPGRN